MQNASIESMIVGVLVSGIVQGLKKADGVDLSAGQTSKINVVVALLSFIGTVITMFLNHNLADTGFWTATVTSLFNWGIAYLSAHGSYAAIIAKIKGLANESQDTEKTSS
jgi:uncharacterized membrane protein YraQ (UPF0718 family)